MEMLPDPEFLDPLEWQITGANAAVANGQLELGYPNDYLYPGSPPKYFTGSVVPTNGKPVSISQRYSYELVVTQDLAGFGGVVFGGVAIWGAPLGTGVFTGTVLPETEDGLYIQGFSALWRFGRISIMAANTDIKALALREIRVHVPDANYKTVMDAFLKASREFCRRTLAWRDTVSVAVAQGDASKEVYNPVDAVVVDFFAPTASKDDPLTKATVAQIKAEDPELLTKQDTPQYAYLASSRNHIGFSPIPDTDYTFHAEVALMPTEAVTMLDDHLWDRWGEAIISGTLYRLFRMPRKPWSDPNLAVAHFNIFEAAIPEARSKAADGHMVGVARKARYGGV